MRLNAFLETYYYGGYTLSKHFNSSLGRRTRSYGRRGSYCQATTHVGIILVELRFPPNV